ncbi:MAG: pseudouridine synthase [Bacteroidetes bacterium]|nr:pseudouridine synthase [Bacteroidota bacterium]
MTSSPYQYFAIHKPYDMVSQFISSHDVRLLGDLNFNFPEGTHAIGRLDNHSEGLLLLTTNPKVTRLLFQGESPHTRKYLIQVKNKVNEESLLQLREGIAIQVKGGLNYITQPCKIEIVSKPEYLDSPAHEIPAQLPHTWLTIELTEGKFHQVRKMVAAIHHKCKRLIRLSIEELTIDNLKTGEVKAIEEKEFFQQLKIRNY